MESTKFFCPWGFPGKNTGVGCHFLLQGIFPTQGSNPYLLHWQANSLPLSHQGNSIIAYFYLKKKKKSLTSFRHFHLPERLLNPKQKSKCSHSCTQELNSFTNFSLPPPSSFVEALWWKAYYKLHALLFPLHSKILSLLWFMLSAKSLQSCLTLCDPIDSSPPGSPVPGILQVRTLEWVAISFSNAWKWKVKVKLLSRVWLLATPWIAAYQAPPSMGFSKQEYWSGVPLLSLEAIIRYGH